MTSSSDVRETDSYITAAAVPGTEHLKSDGLPCQDSARVWRGNGIVILALSDGHGSADYGRSDIGSRIAVEVAIDTVREAIIGWREDPGHFDGARRERAIADAARGHLRRRLILEWYRRVHLHDRMVRLVRDREPPDEDPTGWSEEVKLYGATLLVAAVFDGLCLLLQLGDGEIVLVGAEGTARRVFPAPEKSFGSSATNSLALQPDADRALSDLMEVECLRLGERELRFLLLCSDGVSDPYQPANRAAREAGEQEELHTWWGSRHLKELEDSEDGGWYKWCDQLPRRLSVIGAKSGDDTSVAVAWWPQGPSSRSARLPSHLPLPPETGGEAAKEEEGEASEASDAAAPEEPTSPGTADAHATDAHARDFDPKESRDE